MDPKIYAIRATAGQENVVARLVYKEAASRERKGTVEEGERIYSILYTTGLKGYVLVEADNPGTVEDMTVIDWPGWRWIGWIENS